MGKFWKVECFWERVTNLPSSRGTEGFTDKSFSARCKKSQTNGDGWVGHLILRELWPKGYSWCQKPVSGELGARAWAEPYTPSRSISASFPAEWENQQTWATVGESCVVGSISCVNGKSNHWFTWLFREGDQVKDLCCSVGHRFPLPTQWIQAHWRRRKDLFIRTVTCPGLSNWLFLTTKPQT